MGLSIQENGIIRVELRVRGVVQGVGFRPWIYNLARRHRLSGFVLNSARGVVIEAQGAAEAVDAFVAAMGTEAPPLVRIAEMTRTEIPQAPREPAGEPEFVIRKSEGGEAAFAMVPPDICVCEACLADTADPQNRRFEYPFTNCTNCGPRYSIILDVPYDRPMTTMAEFAMCAACREEYENPENRRFHAQPNACPVCGPRLVLEGAAAAGAREVLDRVADALRDGGIVAWKGLGGYQLACDARRQPIVEELRRRKHRNEKPFAVMVRDAETAASLCFVSERERAALESRERPIVLLRRRPGADLAEAVSPGNPTTGVMLPCTPMHELLFRILQERWGVEAALVMTSGNVSEEPIVTENTEAEQRLGGIADIFAHHNRRIHTRVDDSVVRIVSGETMLLRRARGYTPQPVWLGRGDAEVLACGAQQKNTLCLTRAGFALPSQHLGDLEDFETLRFFEETLERMRRLFHVTPTVVAHDLHPGYLSTQLALRMEGLRKIGVQHHHAHIASCLAEHGLNGRVIGVAWDGTGFGTDGTIWGGEFLAADLTGFERYARLRPVAMAGGDAAVREPWRLARSYLRDAFASVIPEDQRWTQMASPERMRVVDAMLTRGVNAIATSSAGRLFDAVASLIGLRHAVSFEGQAAMMLEAAADKWALDAEPSYEFELSEAAGKPVELDLRPTIRQMVEAIKRGEERGRMAARFHTTLVRAIVTICQRMRTELGLERVCLSGGCFQNALLLDGCREALRAERFTVCVQREVPANDGGISLGQAAVACERVRLGM